MKRFYERYRASDEKLLRAVAVLSWRINVLLIEKRLSDDEVFYYATEVVQKGWNKDLSFNAIKMNMYGAHKDEQRDNKFLKALPQEQAKHANDILHDSYNLGFLGGTEPIAERELENRLDSLVQGK